MNSGASNLRFTFAHLWPRLASGSIAFSLLWCVIATPPAAQAAPGNTQSSPYTVTTSTDPQPDGCLIGDCSLREAILAANASPGPDEILVLGSSSRGFQMEIAPGDPGNATGDLDITDSVIIRGTGGLARIDANGLDRVFDVHANGSGCAV